MIYRLFLLIILIVTIPIFSYAQTHKNIPDALLVEAKTYEDLSLQTLNRASIYLKEGNNYIDSARVVSRLIQDDINNSQASRLIISLEHFYVTAYVFIAKADSMAIVAENYKNISLEKTKEAFGLMGMDVTIERHSPASTSIEVLLNDDKELIETSSNISDQADNIQSLFPASSGSYVIQMGAGNMRMEYFSKIPDIVVVNCKDGIKRFVISGVFTRQEAEKKRKELEKMGYEQIFIRTKASLDKISL